MTEGSEAYPATDPREWFPQARGPVVIIGNPASLFPRHLAALWRSWGMDARIVTRRWNGDSILPDGTPVMASGGHEGPLRRRSYRVLEGLLRQVESRIYARQRDRYEAAMGSEKSYRPFASPWIVDALSISRFVRALRPQFICGQEVFAYGLATSLSRGFPRVIMPWGGDVYMYSETTSLAFALVKYALRHVDLVVPGSALAGEHLQSRFGVPRDRLHVGGLWALDKERFQRATAEENLRIRARFTIGPDDLVVMNVRRFFPAWGSDLALRAFCRFAKEWPSSHFVLLGGAGTEAYVAAARETLAREGLTSRFTLFDGDLPLADCAALMSISDICVSLMRERDMRPLASILEAACAGGAPVLGDQPEYRAMERLGFSALFARSEDPDSAVEAIRQYASSADLRQAAVAQNATYIREHEDGREQATSLLRKVTSLCDAYDIANSRP
jgi:glycosyltransferase involved in cell wall biosynthesis